MNENLFVDWLKHFQNFVKSSEENCVLLIVDNHVSHCTLQAYNYCKENFIVLLTIPPHTSHRTQPLDVSFYSPLKNAYNNECDKYMRSHPGQKITTYEIAELFNNAFGRVATPEKAINGFRATGIFPINPDVFSDDDFLPSQNLQLRLVREETPEPVNDDVAEPANDEAESHQVSRTSFSEIIPIPAPPKSDTVRPQQNNRQQHSQIFTSTPIKDILEQKEKDKAKRLETTKLRVGTARKNVFANRGPSDKIKVTPNKKMKLLKSHQPSTSPASTSQPSTRQSSTRVKKVVKYKNHQEDDSESEVDDSDNDKDANNDICIICGEFGKNNEIWVRCVICAMWAHKACTNDDRKTFVCDFCS